MDTIHFYKYQGAGNDFIIIDNRENFFINDNNCIAYLCDRHFGIGADGLMLLENDADGADFYMRYFNSDGKESTMCGNGGRCMVAFAKYINLGTNKFTFNSIDGIHTGEITNIEGLTCTVKLKMIDVAQVYEDDDKGFYYLNTGSPHHVVFVDNLKDMNVFEEGRKIRNSEMYAPDGTNVNFVELTDSGIFVRTFERGVENETLACGTGVTASAIAAALHTLSDKTTFDVKTLGGNLNVAFEKENNGSFSNIYLQGPATFVFEGHITL